MKKNIILGIAAIILLSAVSFFVFLSPTENNTSSNHVHDLIVLSSSGVEHKFKVELALTPDQQARGLMHRTELAPGTGMLFVFPDVSEKSFYMKNTLIPLDMIFIRKDGYIHRIHENAVPHDLTSIPSNGPVYAVLEVVGGTASRLNIRAGDLVKNQFFKP